MHKIERRLNCMHRLILLHHLLQCSEPNIVTSSLIVPHRWLVLEVNGPPLVRNTILQMQRMVVIKNSASKHVCLDSYFLIALLV